MNLMCWKIRRVTSVSWRMFCFCSMYLLLNYIIFLPLMKIKSCFSAPQKSDQKQRPIQDQYCQGAGWRCTKNQYKQYQTIRTTQLQIRRKCCDTSCLWYCFGQDWQQQPSSYCSWWGHQKFNFLRQIEKGKTTVLIYI